jgi:general secretion pathway protein J
MLSFSGLRLGMRAWEGVDRTAERTAETRIAHGFLARTLRQVRPIRLRLYAEPVLLFAGDAQTLEIVAPLSGYVGVPGLYLLRLALEEGQRNRLVLTRWLLHPDVLAGNGEIPPWEPYDGRGPDFSPIVAGDRDIAAGVFGTTVLVEDAEGLLIEYFGPLDDQSPIAAQGEVDAEWQEDWLGRQTPPLAVRVRLGTPADDWPEMLIRLPATDEG